MVKTLNFMELNYESMHSNKPYAKTLRDTLYRENTNVLSYYILTTILISHFQNFFLWCKHNNTSLLQFKKTPSNQNELCKFIIQHHKTSPFLYNVKCTEQHLAKLLHTTYNTTRKTRQIKPTRKKNMQNTKKNTKKNTNINININNNNKNNMNNTSRIEFVINTMRMSICEVA